MMFYQSSLHHNKFYFIRNKRVLRINFNQEALKTPSHDRPNTGCPDAPAPFPQQTPPVLS